MSEINTTPLIDVMLVLLIMFIITIPIQTHAVKLDLPGGVPPATIETDSNKLVITADGRLLWNGTRLSKSDLSLQLSAVGQMRDQPELHLQPEADARYDLVDDVLSMTKRSHIAKLGFVGNERYAAF
ncbi:MAG TPA: biopolymer transporter ExbD [Sphingomicrobium sp.]|nr:biopolymer transporter ExbD [Sphingomicrobium sp.]